jgi:hypothetical protein
MRITSRQRTSTRERETAAIFFAGNVEGGAKRLVGVMQGTNRLARAPQSAAEADRVAIKIPLRSPHALGKVAEIITSPVLVWNVNFVHAIELRSDLFFPHIFDAGRDIARPGPSSAAMFRALAGRHSV